MIGPKSAAKLTREVLRMTEKLRQGKTIDFARAETLCRTIDAQIAIVRRALKRQR